jgi:hypothetical protein
MNATITAEDISMTAGVLLSLGFSYLPGLNEKFAGLEPTQKRLVMLALLALVTVAIFGLSCFNISLGGSCDQNSAWELIRALILAIIANQSAYALSPRTASHAVRQVVNGS